MIILAIIQGLTEFFPVSSSGHLVLAEALLGVEGKMGPGHGILFEVAVHVGTLGAVVTVYRQKISGILRSFFSWLYSGLEFTEEIKPDLKYILWLLIGSVPAAVVGILMRDWITPLFANPVAASGLLVLTGLYLMLSRGRSGGAGLDWKLALMIGLAQAVAIMPGCSRSGWTITTAILLGAGFKRAAEFSFLLSVPAIIGAFIFELNLTAFHLDIRSVTVLSLGAVVSFISGWLALKLLLGILKRGTFHRFSYYLIPAGLAALLYFYYLQI